MQVRQRCPDAVSGGRLLPDPEILRKLKEIDPESGRWIMDRADTVQKDRRNREYGTPQRSLMTIFKSEAFWRGVRAALDLSFLFNPRAASRSLKYDASPNAAFARVGDDLRTAIRAYMDEKNIPASILTRAELESLEPVASPRAGEKPAPAVKMK